MAFSSALLYDQHKSKEHDEGMRLTSFVIRLEERLHELWRKAISECCRRESVYRGTAGDGSGVSSRTNKSIRVFVKADVAATVFIESIE